MIHTRDSLLQSYAAVRARTAMICAPLEREDHAVQPADFVSPPKWHLGHTTWFFETFILKRYLDGYTVYHPMYQYIFNSYYEALGERVERSRRGALSRPTVDDVHEYRDQVDVLVPQAIMNVSDELLQELGTALEIGLQHEEQHQELLAMDIKYILGMNPLRPPYQNLRNKIALDLVPGEAFLPVKGGLGRIGYSGDGFCFDNERPEHDVLTRDFQMGRGLVTNGEFMRFVEQQGYERHDLWLSDGWAVVQREQWRAPLYWVLIDNNWWEYTMNGLHPLDFDAPVCHVSYYEANAYARFCGARLPTEIEWEIASQQYPQDLAHANVLESGRFHPTHETRAHGDTLHQMIGDVWEWTSSSYLPYPGYQPYEGALGEYNAKFMVNQMVLRGGCCVTPRGHIRPTYRNFFQPEMRWQFSGIRLAKDL